MSSDIDEPLITKDPVRIAKNSNNVRVVGAIAGLGSGFTKARVAVGHGFDTVKTRMQISAHHYNGAIDCFLRIIRKEGLRGLYKGATPPAVGSAAVDFVLLGSLHNFRLHLRNYSFFLEPSPNPAMPNRLTLLGHGVAGLGAGLMSAFVATPFETLKVKLQLQHQARKEERLFKGPIDCARKVVRAEGIYGLWKGLTASLVYRSNFFWNFMGIEALMRASSRLKGTPFEMSEGLANFLAGGLASFGYWLAAIPADAVKNHIFGAPLNTPSSIRGTVKTIYASSGVKGFYRGLTPVLLRAFPVNACAYFVYESILRQLGAEKTRS